MNELKHEFDSAITKHLLFKSKVRAYLYGADIPLAPILDYRECQFGKWIEEKGLPQFGTIPEMQQLNNVHCIIHEHAISLVKLKQAGQQEEALNGIGRLDQIATEIVTLLEAIQRRLRLIN